MKHLYLVKVGEISLKGGNRRFFERMLMKNIREAIAPLPAEVKSSHSRFYVEVDSRVSDTADRALASTFGVVGYARAERVQKDYTAVRDAVFASVAREDRPASTFKIEARRTDKSFPLTSYQLASRLGDDVRTRFPRLKVNVREPHIRIHVEIREQAYVYLNDRPGPGGLPVDAAGRGVCLLSGGIDSPVAAYLMAKRGLRLDAVYFHTYPYTSEQAREKVTKLASLLAGPLSGVDLFTVPFTAAAVHIKRTAVPGEVTLLMRACMMEVASRVCQRRGGLCLVTGESLSQVASQTPESIRFTESRSDLPVFRPLIGLDKQEIISIAERVGTYRTSILPYEDCCTVFTPKRPVIRPDFDRLRRSYERLDASQLLDQAAESAEITHFEPGLTGEA